MPFHMRLLGDEDVTIRLDTESTIGMVTAVAIHRRVELGTCLGDTLERMGRELVTIVHALDERREGQAEGGGDESGREIDFHVQSPLSLRNLVKPVSLRPMMK